MACSAWQQMVRRGFLLTCLAASEVVCRTDSSTFLLIAPLTDAPRARTLHECHTRWDDAPANDANRPEWSNSSGSSSDARPLWTVAVRSFYQLSGNHFALTQLTLLLSGDPRTERFAGVTLCHVTLALYACVRHEFLANCIRLAAQNAHFINA